jgi:hypothetical protein
LRIKIKGLVAYASRIRSRAGHVLKPEEQGKPRDQGEELTRLTESTQRVSTLRARIIKDVMYDRPVPSSVPKKQFST